MKNIKLIKNILPFQKFKRVVVRTRLRERKDHFVITIYENDRNKLGASIGDVIIFILNGVELIRPIRKGFHVSLPKKLLKRKRHGKRINLKIIKLTKKEDCFKRPNKWLCKNKLDIRYFLNEKTSHNYPLYVIPRNEYASSIWFPICGGVNHVTLNNEVNVNRIAELLGFYFGDGTKCQGIQSLRLTNCEPSILIYCLNILKEMGISRHKLKVQVIYCTPHEITEDIKSCCVDFWSKTLHLHKNQIVSVTKSYNVRETKKHGSARVFIDSSVLVQVIVRSLLKNIIKKITNPKDEMDYQLLKGFMRGLLAAEGFPETNIHGSLVKVGIAYNPHSDELNLYRNLLNNLGIKYNATHGNALYVYHHKNMEKFNEFEAFKLHTTRNKKFLEGYKKNPRIKSLE